MPYEPHSSFKEQSPLRSMTSRSEVLSKLMQLLTIQDGTDDGGDGEEEEEEEEKPEVKVQTAPMDVRFVTTNQARHCYTRYQEYHKCAKEKGDDNPDCTFFQKAYRSICPGDWVDRYHTTLSYILPFKFPYFLPL